MTFQAISRIKQVARITLQAARIRPFTTSGNTWFKSPADIYQPGHCLPLVLEGNKPTEVKIVKAFTPFTCSVVLLVDAQTSARSIGLPDRFVLKLADRRAHKLWNPVLEEEYQSNMSGHGPSFKLDNDDSDEDPLPWTQLFDLWETFNDSHIKEREAYGRLKEAQASGLVPRFFGTAKIDMMSMAQHPSLSHIDGLLIEYIPGRSMARFRPGIDITLEEAEIISQRVLELGRRLRRFGVTHTDVHVGNVILREENNFPVLIDWGRASIRFADLPLQERWNDENIWTDFHRDIRIILQTGDYYEGPNDDVVHPAITAGGIWHRFRTPLSDEEQERFAEEWSYGWANRNVTSLSAEEIALFYDEDLNVDPRHGLRFRVKKGIKTRKVDDPCPVD
ncbi:hypothetical protein C0992_001878 [Termitomyces sp. T32_za158]|nr:hypothetical protein C0992_001878 [Termitomyces sp. T32_za158]